MPVPPMMSDSFGRPAFLVTIDTEGDNLWAKPRLFTTKNAAFLPRFQALCERYGLRPTYLTDWEMIESPAFREFASDVLQRGIGEIGMHLHAWNTPPFFPLTDDDGRYCPYLIEYPEASIRDKVRTMTNRLEDTLGTKMVSHRAGQWSFNAVYARALVENGYHVDCSVTPHVSWKAQLRSPTGSGGTDFSSYPEDAYFLDLDDIGRPGESSLLELPMTIRRTRRPAPVELADAILPHGIASSARLARRLEHVFPKYTWLRPNGRNLQAMLNTLREASRSGCGYVEFMLHSSELMPGGSPTFPTADSIAKLYEHLDALFSTAQHSFGGQTLAEYYEVLSAQRTSHQGVANG